MAIEFPWGDGKTYADLPEALAGAASYGLTLADNYELPGYLNTGSSKDYNHATTVNVPLFNTGTGVYQVHIYGAVGSMSTGDQITLNITSGDGVDTNSINQGLIIENLKVVATGNYAFNYGGSTQAALINCYSDTAITGLSGGSDTLILGCFLEGSVRGAAFGSGNGHRAMWSIFKGNGSYGVSSARNYVSYTSCIIWGKTHAVDNWRLRWTATNSVFVGGTYAILSITLGTYRYSTTCSNVIFYSESNPTKITSTGGLDAFGGCEALFDNTVIDDPEFSKTGTGQSWFIPNGTSPLRVGNQSFIENILYGTNRDKISQGAWSDATEVAAADDIITSAGGNYDDTNLIPSNVKDTVTYGVGEVGNYDEDYPIVEDVFLGTEYANGNLTGTFAPYATTERTGNVTIPIELDVRDGVTYDSLLSKTGLLETPSTTDVRNGVEYDSTTKTGSAYIPAPANVRETVPVDATVGTLHVPSVSEDDVRDGTTF